VVDAEARPPDDVCDDHSSGAEPTVIEDLLDERGGRFVGCIVHRCDDPVDVAGQRRHHCQAGFRPEQDDLVGRCLAAQPDVGQRERLLICAALEADAGLFAHGAVDTVGADDVARPDHVAVVKRGCHAVGVLSHRRQRLRPDDRAAEFGQPIEQQPFGRRLRDHQRVREFSRQHREVDGDQGATAVADGEPRRLYALLDQSAGHVEVVENLERARVDDGGA
jgi:hypothetical protein